MGGFLLASKTWRLRRVVEQTLPSINWPVKQLRTMKPTRFRLDTHSGSKTATTARLTSMSERSRFQLAVFGTAINLGTLSPFN